MAHLSDKQRHLAEDMDQLKKAPGFFIKQEWEALEQISSCYEASNKYTVFSIPRNEEDRKKGMQGSTIFFEAKEQTGCCARNCCGENRPFEFNFEHVESKDSLVKINRGIACCGWAVIPCCAHRVNVHSMVSGNEQDGLNLVSDTSDETLVARVQTPPWHGGCLLPTYYLYVNDDTQGRGNLKYEGKITGNSCWFLPCCVCDSCGADFKAVNKDGEEVAKIDKLGIGGCKDILYELRTDADKYTVEFSKDKEAELTLNFKLAVMAAAIQIDFNFFEDERGVQQCRCCDWYCCGYACGWMPVCCLALCCCGGSKKDEQKKDPLLEKEGGAPASAEMHL